MSANYDPTPLYVEQFQSEFRLAYQMPGISLRNWVRQKLGITGTQTTFNNYAAIGKPKNKGLMDDVPTTGMQPTLVPCVLDPRWLGVPVADVAKTFMLVDERQAIAQSLAYSFARDEDEVILNAMTATTNAANNTASDDAWTDLSAIEAVAKAFGDASVFRRPGNVYGLVTWNTWNLLRRLTVFIDAEVGGDPNLTRSGIAAKMLYGIWMMPYEGLPFNSGTSGPKLNLFWHQEAVGFATGADGMREPMVERIPEKDSYLIQARSVRGACLIDSVGVIKRRVAS